ncbi:MAG: methyltransferase domain-containing protein [Oscillospiraceae bacterium]|nr:methyltransferase domain-containing protein [Oscillospiraceae bacterium]
MRGVREYYDKTAAEWAENGYKDGADLPCLDEFLSLLPPGGRVLDLCCGAGYETGRIRARGFEALGLDFSGESLKIARQRNPGISFFQGDMLEDYARVGAVDGVLLSAGLVHVETADLPLAFARMAGVVRPGGYVLASIREGTGKLAQWSLREIDGEQYDRSFIAHTPEEVVRGAERWFSYCRELPSDMAVWRQLLFRRTGADT